MIIDIVYCVFGFICGIVVGSLCWWFGLSSFYDPENKKIKIKRKGKSCLTCKHLRQYKKGIHFISGEPKYRCFFEHGYSFDVAPDYCVFYEKRLGDDK